MSIIHFTEIPAIFSFFLVLSVFPCSAQSRGMYVEAETAGGSLTVGRQYCLLIAMNRYHAWLPLENPVRDAKALKRVLEDRYHMDEFIELYDEKATKQNILAAFTRFRDKLAINDSLLIYFAGHGYYAKTTSTGFWIPFDAGTDRLEQENWISNSEIGNSVAELTAKHVFLISDSCFSGGILNLARGLDTWEEFEEAAQYFNKAYDLVSRQVITSGAIEDVPDRSSFSQALITALRHNKKLLIDPYMLFSEIRVAVKETTPLIGNLKTAGHEDGASFLLFLQQEAARRDDIPGADSKFAFPFYAGAGGGIMFPVGNVGTIMDEGSRVEAVIGFQFGTGQVTCLSGITLGTFTSVTGSRSPYAYKIRAFSYGCTGRVEFSLGMGAVFAECALGAITGAVDYLQPYIGITDLSFTKPYCQPGLGFKPQLPVPVTLNFTCSFLALFLDNNPYLAILPSIRIEYEN